MTEKLYYLDSHMAVFTAVVISCEPFGDDFRAVLDRTAFFPQGGGQAADQGTLNGIAVLDVQEEEGVIYHQIAEALIPGEKVCGRIDWDIRFSRMQQHTAEHIISGLIHRTYGYHNVGFHLADTYCTLDLDGPLTKAELREIENQANQVVFQNLPIEICYPSEQELETMDYRSKIEIKGQVRIVRVPGYDVCACCAPHVKCTGEIGLIKFVHSQNYKGGVRITMKSGDRALQDYQAKEESVKAIMFCLASKEEEIAKAVEELKKENAALKSKFLNQQRRLLQNRAEAISKDTYSVCLFEDALEGNGARELMNLVLERGITICAVFVGNEENGFQYVIGSHCEDIRMLGKGMNERLEGRGGGKSNMIQGSLKGTKDQIERVFQENVDKIRK